jgi:transposase
MNYFCEVIAALEKFSKEELIHEVITLKTELSQLKRMIFGSKSERFVPEVSSEQISLELNIDPDKIGTPSLQKETITYQREKKQNKNKVHCGRTPIPAHIPRIEIEILPAEDITGLKSIGSEITEELEYKPGSFYVNKYVRKKYLKEKNESESEIIIAQLPARPIEKGIAGPSLLANIIIEKFVDHLPLYRQQQRFSRAGINLPGSTIVGWVNACCELLNPLYDVLKKEVLSQNYIQADETPIAVLDQNKKQTTHQGYHWVYHAPQIKMTLFDYQKGRSREGPKGILKNFSGHLQTDGYNAYTIFDGSTSLTTKITLLHCMAHARRKFEQAIDNDKVRAEYFLAQMQKLYSIERKAREENFSSAQRYELRQSESVFVLEEIKLWLKENITQVLPKSSIGEAIAYSLARWEKLSIYTADGKLEIDNNLVENVIRPVALGRKNYLFAGSHDAAQRAAMLYSFTGTCKLRGVEPLAWLTKTLSLMPDHKANRLAELLPA